MDDMIQMRLSLEGLRRFIEEAKANVPEEKAREYQAGTNRKNATERLVKLIEGNSNLLMIKSKDGEEARLSRKSVGKLVSETSLNKSIANGFTKGQHFAVAADIYNVFENSVKALTLPDKNRSPDMVAIHRFIAPLFENSAAFITVKESFQQGKKIYSIELIELGRLEGKVTELKLNFTSNPATSHPY